ncbi:hypothetical protein ACFL6S_14540 [Candidatus Poribacteria bacterium]
MKGKFSASISVLVIAACALFFAYGAVNPANAVLDLEITKSADPDPVIAGDELIYTITVDNIGDVTMTNVVVEDDLPWEVTFISGPVGSTYSAGVVTIPLGTIEVGDSVTFQIVVEVGADLVLYTTDGWTTITSTADVLSGGSEYDTVDLHTLVTDEADLKVTKFCKPDAETGLKAGEIGECIIYVDNLGPSDARNVVLYDQIVSSGSFIILNTETSQGNVTSIDIGVNTATITWNLGVLPVASDPAHLIIHVLSNDGVDINDEASVVSDTNDPNPNNDQAQGKLVGKPVADLGIAKSGPPTVVAGQSLVYTLWVTNHGPSIAENVVVEDFLPAGVVVDGMSVPGVIGVPGDPLQPTTIAYASIGVGDVMQMYIYVTVLPQTTGTLHNNASVSSDTVDKNNANDNATAQTGVVAQADLVVAKLDSPDPVLAGAGLTYEVTVTNNGPSTAQDVTLLDNLPTEVELVGASITYGSGTWAPIGLPPTAVSFQFGALDPGDHVEVSIDVKVLPSVPDGTTITNTATASYSTPDPVPGDEVVTEDTLVEAEADLAIMKTSSQDTYGPSDTIVYTVTIKNLGPSDAQDVVIVDTLPAPKKKVIYKFDTGGCTYDKGAHTLTCNVGTLGAGEEFSFDIHVVTKGSLGIITNTAMVSSSTGDSIPGNNTATKDVKTEGGLPTPGGGKKPRKK